jgi:hypothetical protein
VGPRPLRPRPAGRCALNPRLWGKVFAERQNIAPAERRELRSASAAERKAILKKAGFTDEELHAVEQMRKHSGPANGPVSSCRKTGPCP